MTGEIGELLAGLDKLDAKRTKGPWSAIWNEHAGAWEIGNDENKVGIGLIFDKENAALIVALENAYPKHRSEIGELRKALEEIVMWTDDETVAKIARSALTRSGNTEDGV